VWRVLLSLLVLVAGNTAPAERGRVAPPPIPDAMPAELVAELTARTITGVSCTRTRIGPSTVTAAHCVSSLEWSVDGDRAHQGPPVDWLPAEQIPRGATLYAVGYPVGAPGAQAFTLAVLGVRTVSTFPRGPLRVLMAVGDGVPCTQGSSGMVAFTMVTGEERPVGTLSVFATDPAVTGLPAGQYVCGFAV